MRSCSSHSERYPLDVRAATGWSIVKSQAPRSTVTSLEPDWLRTGPSAACRRTRGDLMSATDKIHNATESATGKIKEAVGKGTDDEGLETEGKSDQASADLKQAGEKVKDAFGH